MRPSGLRPAPSPTVLLSESYETAAQEYEVCDRTQTANPRPCTLSTPNLHPGLISAPPMGNQGACWVLVGRASMLFFPRACGVCQTPRPVGPPNFMGFSEGVKCMFCQCPVCPLSLSLSLCFCPTWGKCEIPRERPSHPRSSSSLLLACSPSLSLPSSLCLCLPDL